MKLAAKYDDELEKKQRVWISQVTNIPIPEDMSFHELLKDGIILVSLSEALSPGIIKKPFPHLKLLNSFRCMENIQAFLEVCEGFGLGQHSLFQTCDLYSAFGFRLKMGFFVNKKKTFFFSRNGRFSNSQVFMPNLRVLYDGSNMTQVQTLISQLASVATSKGIDNFLKTIFFSIHYRNTIK